ncbi:hypothetical protein HK098_007510 [Nowakowskiella sp. JEL0407]|nr:hypothetical protein HK098_007510 [Nowakowskiella sp. JEL0407]
MHPHLQINTNTSSYLSVDSNLSPHSSYPPSWNGTPVTSPTLSSTSSWSQDFPFNASSASPNSPYYMPPLSLDNLSVASGYSSTSNSPNEEMLGFSPSVPVNLIDGDFMYPMQQPQQSSFFPSNLLDAGSISFASDNLQYMGNMPSIEITPAAPNANSELNRLFGLGQRQLTPFPIPASNDHNFANLAGSISAPSINIVSSAGNNVTVPETPIIEITPPVDELSLEFLKIVNASTDGSSQANFSDQNPYGLKNTNRLDSQGTLFNGYAEQLQQADVDLQNIHLQNQYRNMISSNNGISIITSDSQLTGPTFDIYSTSPILDDFLGTTGANRTRLNSDSSSTSLSPNLYLSPSTYNDDHNRSESKKLRVSTSSTSLRRKPSLSTSPTIQPVNFKKDRRKSGSRSPNASPQLSPRHDGQEEFYCPFAQKGLCLHTSPFTRRYNLKVHMTVHEDERVKNHACRCGKSYYRHNELKRHLRTCKIVNENGSAGTQLS